MDDETMFVSMGQVNHSEDVESQIFLGASRVHHKPYKGVFHSGLCGREFSLLSSFSYTS